MAIDLAKLGGGQPAARAPSAPASLGFGRGPALAARERAELTERLALLLESGVALHAALKGLELQSEKPEVRALLGQIAGEVMGGKSLSHALAAHPRSFSVAYVNMVAAAEKGGYLFQALNQIVAMEARQQALHEALRGALAYPAFLSLFSVAVVVFVLVAVFPKFSEMFDSIRGQLPVSTLTLMALSELLSKYWAPLLAGLGAAIFLVVRWAGQPRGKAVLDALALRVPGLRTLLLQVYVARVMRVMGASLGNGVSVIDTLRACGETVSNGEFRAFMLRVQDKVTQGQRFATAFGETRFVPAMVRQMLATGDETGTLATVMARVADFYERELLRRIAFVSRLAEPVMLMVMGLVVGVIVSSLILPIFKLAKAVG